MISLFEKQPSTNQQRPEEPEDIPRYPPFLKGLPVVSPRQLQNTQKDLIDRLQQALGLKHLEFEKLIQPSIDRLVAHVHLLPASEHHHHHGAGGLLRHSLEVAFWSVQAAEGVIFVAEGTPIEKKVLEPRWRVATAVAGLFHDIGKPVSDLSVTDQEGRSTWNPFQETLLCWAERHAVDRYFIHWRGQRCKRHEQFSVLALNRVMTSPLLAWLTEPGPEILQVMLSAMGNTDREHVLSRLVIDADRISVDRDLKTHRMSVDENALGVPVERYLIDAMRRLLASSQWLVNQRNARVWVVDDGVFVIWKQAANDITELLAVDRIPGIPRDPDTLADILIERGYAQSNTSESGQIWRYWPVAPDILQKDDKPAQLMMLKLSDPGLLFTSSIPPTVSASVGKPDDEKASRRAKPTNDPPASDRKPDQQCELPLATKPEQPNSNEAPAPSVSPPKEEALIEPEASTSYAIPDDLDWLSHAHSAIRKVGQQVVITYPDGIKRWIEPKRLLARLSELGWLDLDPAFPGRKVRTLHGVRGLVLTVDASRVVLSEVENARGVPPTVDDVMLTAKTSGSSSPTTDPPRLSAARAPVPISAQSSDKDNKKRRATNFVQDFVTLLIDEQSRVTEHDTDAIRVPTEKVLAKAREQGIQPGELFRALINHPQCRLQDSELQVQIAGGQSAMSDDERNPL